MLRQAQHDKATASMTEATAQQHDGALSSRARLVILRHPVMLSLSKDDLATRLSLSCFDRLSMTEATASAA
jgi:hypothetical protein